MRSRISVFTSPFLIVVFALIIFTCTACEPDTQVALNLKAPGKGGPVGPADASALITAINDRRRLDRLPPLSPSTSISTAAQQYSTALMTTSADRYYFTAGGKPASWYLRNNGVIYCEVAHIGAFNYGTVTDVMAELNATKSLVLWKNDYTRIGIGVASPNVAGTNDYWTIFLVN